VTDRHRRLSRLVFGLVLFGVGLALMVAADLGLPPWDVLHQGMSRRMPITIGQAGIAVGIVLLGGMRALREPFGIGTVLNIIIIGLVLDGTLLIVGDPTSMVTRVCCLAAGPLLVAVGSGFYLGARLGPGPRDGLMTALARRNVAVWKARSFIEGAAFIAGVAMGGTTGVGTVWFLVIIGPAVHVALPRLDMGPVSNRTDPTPSDRPATPLRP